jgi:tricorn protease
MGSLVGMPVPGTMTSVNWIYMQDPTVYFGVPVIGYRTAEGNYLENTQLEPDYLIANDPEVVVTGEDQQLKKAVEVLLQQIDKK